MGYLGLEEKIIKMQLKERSMADAVAAVCSVNAPLFTHSVYEVHERRHMKDEFNVHDYKH